MSKISDAVDELVFDQIYRADWLANELQKCGHEITTSCVLHALGIARYQLIAATTSISIAIYEEYMGGRIPRSDSEKKETETEETPFTEPVKPQRTRINLRDAYPRNGFSWTPAEDRNLMVYRLANLDIDEMADLLGRSPKAIRDHILVVDGKRLPNGTVVR